MKATKVNAGLAESNGRLLLGIWRDSLHVTCGLTACTPGSAPGPTLGNEYGKTLPLPRYTRLQFLRAVSHAVGADMMISDSQSEADSNDDTEDEDDCTQPQQQ